MHRRAITPPEPETELMPQLLLARWSWWWRVLLVSAPLTGLALLCGASNSVTVLVVTVAWLAMIVERTAVRAEADRSMRSALHAAHDDGQHHAAAMAMAREMALDRMRTVLDVLREGVMVVDRDGRIVLANPAARRAMSPAAQDCAGRPLWEVLSSPLAERAREAWEALRNAPPDSGEPARVMYSGIPFRDVVYDLTAIEATSGRTGNDFGVVFSLIDSTRQYELQRLKDRFLSSVSHELRTPLTNICAYAELIAGLPAGGSAELPEFVRVIHEEGLQLSALVESMLDYLQLESGEARFASEVLDAEAVVRKATAAFADRATKRGLSLSVSIDADAPKLFGDKKRVDQVLENLIDNAIKFTPPGGSVRVSLRTHGDGWELRVEDSGPGVPEASRETVFEKFHQLQDHLTEKPTGAGLGLATNRAIVAGMGGMIWCEDSPLGGAAFVVVLPGMGQPSLATVGSGGGF
jgi:two-component system phosphate regulon sensor histidine kinase PhoR